MGLQSRQRPTSLENTPSKEDFSSRHKDNSGRSAPIPACTDAGGVLGAGKSGLWEEGGTSRTSQRSTYSLIANSPVDITAGAQVTASLWAAPTCTRGHTGSQQSQEIEVASHAPSLASAPTQSCCLPSGQRMGKAVEM